MIGVLDYGIGNVAAILKSYQILGIPAQAISDPSKCEKAAALILPGVGSFDMVMSALTSSGFVGALNSSVLDKGLPILGICVGMQVMAQSSTEGNLPGLGWIDAEVLSFKESTPNSFLRKPIPHMGWNYASPSKPGRLFTQPRDAFYFLHSYYLSEVEGCGEFATTEYGIDFVSGFEIGNLNAVQFHPEKSHDSGLRLLRAFWLKVDDA